MWPRSRETGSQPRATFNVHELAQQQHFDGDRQPEAVPDNTVLAVGTEGGWLDEEEAAVSGVCSRISLSTFPSLLYSFQRLLRGLSPGKREIFPSKCKYLSVLCFKSSYGFSAHQNKIEGTQNGLQGPE